jgi:hypothetical protein
VTDAQKMDGLQRAVEAEIERVGRSDFDAQVCQGALVISRGSHVWGSWRLVLGRFEFSRAGYSGPTFTTIDAAIAVEHTMRVLGA